MLVMIQFHYDLFIKLPYTYVQYYIIIINITESNLLIKHPSIHGERPFLNTSSININ